MRKTGYLASIFNIPPIIFRFQFNPEMMTEKKAYEYQPGTLGQFGFDKTSAASGFGVIGGLVDDFKEIGSILTNVKPLTATEGKPREIALEFTLRAGEITEALSEISDGYVRDSIEPDLATLRSFMNPSLSLFDLPDVIGAIGGSSGGAAAAATASVSTGGASASGGGGGGSSASSFQWKKPPECTFKYGELSLACVMTSLSIKHQEFNEDARPTKADVSITLKEQSHSFDTSVDFIVRYINVFKTYGRDGFWTTDLGAVAPVAGAFLY